MRKNAAGGKNVVGENCEVKKGGRFFYPSLLILLFLILPMAAFPQRIIVTLFVDNNPNVPGPRNGLSWDRAYAKIQDAINHPSSLYAPIWVADGEYRENLDIYTPDKAASPSGININVITQGYRLYGGFEGYGGAEETNLTQRNIALNPTIINGIGPQAVVTVNQQQNSRIDGFTIMGAFKSFSGEADEGGGIAYWSCNNTNIISHCIIRDNFAPSGGGIYCGDSSPVIENCVLTANEAEDGSAIYCFKSSPSILFCTISQNYTDGEAALAYRNDSHPIIRNSIFSHNEYYALKDLFQINPNTITLDNCIFWGNDAAYNGPGGVLADSEINELPGAVNNLNEDPAFASLVTGDFHLTYCSAALDEATTPGAPNTDCDENTRPVDIPDVGKDGTNNGYDIGAYEFQQGTNLSVNPVRIDFGPFPVNQGESDPILISLSNIGMETIEFTDIALSDAEHFYFSETPDLSPLEPCQSRVLYLFFNPSAPESYETTMTVQSNDSSKPDWDLPVNGLGVNQAPIAGRYPQGSAIDFDNWGAHLDCGDSNTLMPGSAITLEAWVNPYSMGGIFMAGGPVIVKDRNNNNPAGYFLYADDTGRVLFRILNSNSQWRWVFSPALLKAEEWRHIAGVYDGVNIKVFIDGVEQNSNAVQAASGIAPANSNFLIGGTPDFGSFPGMIDEVRCWNYARSQTEIQETMYIELKGDETGLLGYWHMDEGMGSLSLDATANANHGTLKEGPSWETPGYEPVLEQETFIDVDIDDFEILLSLSGYDPEFDPITSTIKILPDKGTLYQYENGDEGDLIDTVPTEVSDSEERRVIYVLPDDPIQDDIVTVKYIVSDPQLDSTTATIHIRFVDRHISVSAESIDFGSVRIDPSSIPGRIITIQNTGNTALSFVGSQIELIQGPIPQFFINSDTGENPLNPLGSRTIEITFIPDSIGNKTAQLGIFSNDLNEPEFYVDIYGYGNMPPVAGVHPTGSNLKFNGTDQYVAIPNNTEYNLGSSFTLEAWVKPDSVDNSYQCILSSHYPSDDGGIAFGRHGERLFLTLYNDAQYYAKMNYLNGGKWSHVAVVFDNSEDVHFYWNGSLMETIEANAAIPNLSLGNLRIGAAASGPFNGWNGEIDEVRIWNIARTEEEIRSNMCLVIKTNIAGLVGNWSMDDNLGAIAHDSSENHNHGTLFGSPEWIVPSGAGVADGDAVTGASRIADSIIMLDGFDMDGDAITATIDMIPPEGELYQYNAGTRGDLIGTIPTLVQDESLRVIFAPPPDPVLYTSTELHFSVNDGLGDSFNSAILHLEYVDRKITATPDSLDFGIETIGAPSGIPQAVTISNDGVTTLTFTSVEKEISGGDAIDFKIFDDSGEAYLLKGQSRTIQIIFDPQTRGEKLAALLIYSDDPTTPVAKATLSGYANTRPQAGQYIDENALQFNGIDQFVLIPYSSTLDLTNNFTLEAWVKTSSSNWDGIARILSSRDNYFGGGIGFGRYGSGLIFTTYGVNDYYSAGDLLKPEEWAHIAVSLDASNDASFYVNGQPAGFVSAFAPGQSTTRPLHIGVCPVDPSENWNGVIDELRIWNKVRSKTEIQNDMSSRLTGSEPNLVAYWNFDEGKGTVLGDSTQNHLDGVIYNSPLWVISKQTPGYFFDVLGIFARDDQDTTVTLYGYDADGDPLKAYITQLPEPGFGEVYQFAGSGPVRGAKITAPDTQITDPQMRLVFAPENLTEDYQTILRWKVFDDVVYSNNPTTYTLTIWDFIPLSEKVFLDHFLGKHAIPEYRFDEADLNGDGKIDVADLVMFIRRKK